VQIDGNKVSVNIGEVEHPMTAEHYIQWITVNANGVIQRKALTPEDKPHADFVFEDAVSKINVYEYCNLHGLWEKEI
ncbi:MAG: desulfoferrodoxin, partial [Clostridiales Family XIII bacterium]|nr:desulfoferrodoxin [Clostridiales Family XIII bacterium]